MQFKLKLTFLFCFISLFSFAQQNDLKIKVQDSKTHEPLIGATVYLKSNTKIGQNTDENGQVLFRNLTGNALVFIATYVGYTKKEVAISIPLSAESQPIIIDLEATQEALEEVIVTSSRTNSRIEDLPIKVEVLGQEDMDEESTMVPGNVSSILGDISIIHIQKTSAVNGNQAIRMQGLDSKYTQILRDGIPLFEGFSGNLGILAIPPLDLKQVEVVKGSVSTLYGGGAIGGMINIISKTPTNSAPEITAIINRSTLKETNLNTFYAQKFGKAGLTFFAGLTDQKSVDVNADGFSDSPLIKQYSVHPRFFYNFSEKTKINLGYSYINEMRVGGYVSQVNSNQKLPNYVSANDFRRHTIDYNYAQNLPKNHNLTIKGAISYFDRNFTETQYFLKANQTSSYSEISDFWQTKNHKVILGGNFTTENFNKPGIDSTNFSSFQYHTTGLFAQDDWQLNPKISFQTGLRYDVHSKFGKFILPRFSLMVKPTEQFTIRTSIGAGYKTPNLFANQIPANSLTDISYWNLQALAPNLKHEHSIGANMDIAYSNHFGEHLTIQLDQAFYFTQINNPIVALGYFDSFLKKQKVSLSNAENKVNSIGTDTYLRMQYEAIELYLGYNHTIAKYIGGQSDGIFVPFSPHDKFSLTAAYTIEGKWRFGAENSFVGNQYLYNNQKVKNYIFWAAAVERKFGPHFSLICNAENIGNIKQSNYEKMVTGSLQNPSIVPIWAPQEGVIVNLALKIKNF